MNKKKLLTIGISTVAGLGVIAAGAGVTKVAAATATTEYPLIIQNLAEKFGVKESEVAQVFETTREERFEERLDALVSDGKLTEAQKTKLIAKHKEIEAEREKIMDQSLTASERREKLQALHEKFEQWLEDNDISIELGRGMGREGMHRGMGGEGFGMGMGL
ncbi:MAG: hypothetical protein Fur003_2850 [Candidatus Dojkabacteria bacterium]